MKHTLKCEERYYCETIEGNKMFEIRHNDRDFQCGDYVLLREISDFTNGYTKREQLFRITFVTRFAQKENYVVFGITPDLLANKEEGNEVR